jgi:cation transport regulator ChaB
MGAELTAPLLTGRPYSGAGDDSLPDNVKALPDHAKAIWVAAFNAAYKGWSAGKTDLDQEGYAMATAWAAVNKGYKKDAQGNWSKRTIIEGAEGHFTRVWRAADGRYRWRATISDDGVDQYATRMTLDFLNDMATRAMAPGGMPWLGIAHYDAFSEIGKPDRIYVQGRQLKAEGTFLTESRNRLQRDLATAAFERARAEAAMLPEQRSIHTSIAFRPEAFDIEDLGIVAYTRGALDHVALTTRPANSRADFMAEEGDTMSRSKGLRELRREDAAAIVGDDLAERLFEKDDPTNSARSIAREGLVYRTRLEGGEHKIEVSADGGETYQDVESWRNSLIGNPDQLLHRATELWRLETVADPAEEGALLGVVAAIRADLASGAIPKPTLAEAIAMFEGAHDIGAALLRATGETEFPAALKAIVSNPEGVDALMAGIAAARALDAEERAGRRIKGEVLAEMQTAITSLGEMASSIKSLKDILEWATENLPDEGGSPKRSVSPAEPAEPFADVLARRLFVPPDSDLELTMKIEDRQQVLRERLSRATWALEDIIQANVAADPAEVDLERRMVNVQSALNEYEQIIGQVIVGSVQRSVSADGEGIKPGDAAEGAAESPTGEPNPAAQTVEDVLEEIRAFTHGAERDPERAQVLLEGLAAGLYPLLTRPAPTEPEGSLAALEPLMARFESLERTVAALAALMERRAEDGTPPPAPPLSPRRSSGLPPPRRSVAPLGPAPQRQDRGNRPLTPREFVEGAHKSRGFNPYE